VVSSSKRLSFTSAPTGNVLTPALVGLLHRQGVPPAVEGGYDSLVRQAEIPATVAALMAAGGVELPSRYEGDLTPARIAAMSASVA
jgi:hypothetical protein